MDLGERIRLLRAEKSLTLRELSEAIGVSAVSVGCWESGSKTPSVSAVISLSETFGVPTDYLLGVSSAPSSGVLSPMTKQEIRLLSDYRDLDQHGKKIVGIVCSAEKARVEENKGLIPTNTNEMINIRKPSRYIPKYITPSAAGNSIPLDGDDFEMILVDESVPTDADFAVKIQGDSMNPYIHDGDTVYVKKTCELEPGDIGIFCVDGSMYCKQYYIDKRGGLILLSSNPHLRHTNVSIPADSHSSVQCYGKVLIGFRVDFPEYIRLSSP